MTPWLSTFVLLMREPVPRMFVQSLPSPPDHFDSCALSESALKMCAEVVLDRREVARRQLRMRRARMEQRRRRRHVEQVRHQVVELDRAARAIRLVDREAHRHAHPERLRHLDGAAVMTRQVAIGERLDAEILEQPVAFRLERRGQRVEIEGAEALVEEARVEAVADGDAERHPVGGVALFRRIGQRLPRHLFEQRFELQARGEVAVGRIVLDERGGRQHERPLDLRGRDAVEDRAHRFLHDAVDRHVRAEVGGEALDALLALLQVEEDDAPVARLHGEPADARPLESLRSSSRHVRAGGRRDTGCRPSRSRRALRGRDASRRCPGCSRRSGRSR